MRFESWNMGSLTGKLVEVVEVMRRRRINILCLQETKWVGNKERYIAQWGYKLWYSGKTRGRNGVGILIDQEYIDDVVDVSRKSDRIMSIKLVIGDEVVTIEDLKEVVQRVPRSEKLIIGGDLNGHVGSSRDVFESIHGGFGYEERNEVGNAIFDFALAYDLGIMNTWFGKRESHLVTYRSGDNTSQIDLFLVRNALRQCYTNCKVIAGESTTTQHRLVVLNFRGRSYMRRRRPLVEPRIKWWKLQGEKQLKFVEKVANEGIWAGDMDLDIDSLYMDKNGAHHKGSGERGSRGI
ncbi:uncharacterized protein [Spinacia oleracea]|uniref:Endonuclease/exonuclease/phosphatase domain-containing protein n=1 Tax=Spinacia oleracea TaxID=3562 RepID=A0A9R0K2Q2_SPIOL|nr:uncharacterized protein LOC110795576 [Spinacia oleracea]